MPWTAVLTKIEILVLNSDMQFTLQKASSWSIDKSKISWSAALCWLALSNWFKSGSTFALNEVKHQICSKSYLQLFWVSVLCILLWRKRASPIAHASTHGLRCPSNEAFFHRKSNFWAWAYNLGRYILGHLGGIFGQFISTHLGTILWVYVSPLSMFSINQPLFQQTSLYISKYLFGVGIRIWTAKN